MPAALLRAAAQERALSQAALRIFEEDREDTLLLLAPVAGVLVVADGSVAGVAVRDWGVGVGAEKPCHAFEPSYRAEGTSAALPGGTGLGLSIAKAIVQRRGLCLWGHSPPGGRGSTFGFCPPREDGEA